MSEQEKLETIADVLEMDADDISANTILDDCEAWDSIAVLSIIAVMNESFNRFPHASEIMSYKTVGDLIGAMN